MDMETVVACPTCREESSLDVKFDAWARYLIVGVDPNGNLKLSSDFDTQVFDHHEIECSSCGRKFSEEEIVNHLSRADNNAEN
jgi:hypothetical protein